MTDTTCARCNHGWRESYCILRASGGALGGTPSLSEARDLPVSATRFHLATAPACWRCRPSGETYHYPPPPPLPPLPSAAKENL